jgi:spermidine synthase
MLFMPLTARFINPMTALFFFLSGFCGLLYQIVWMRLAYASFGIITPVMSVVLSVFMAGLALGSWFGGRLASRWSNSSAGVALLAYASVEFLIGLGAFLVPRLFILGRLTLPPIAGI